MSSSSLSSISLLVYLHYMVKKVVFFFNFFFPCSGRYVQYVRMFTDAYNLYINSHLPHGMFNYLSFMVIPVKTLLTH